MKKQLRRPLAALLAALSLFLPITNALGAKARDTFSDKSLYKIDSRLLLCDGMVTDPSQNPTPRGLARCAGYLSWGAPALTLADAELQAHLNDLPCTIAPDVSAASPRVADNVLLSTLYEAASFRLGLMSADSTLRVPQTPAKNATYALTSGSVALCVLGNSRLTFTAGDAVFTVDGSFAGALLCAGDTLAIVAARGGGLLSFGGAQRVVAGGAITLSLTDGTVETTDALENGFGGTDEAEWAAVLAYLQTDLEKDALRTFTLSDPASGPSIALALQTLGYDLCQNPTCQARGLMHFLLPCGKTVGGHYICDGRNHNLHLGACGQYMCNSQSHAACPFCGGWRCVGGPHGKGRCAP